MLHDACNSADRIETDIVVVDPREREYADWAHASPARVALCSTAGEALRLSSSKPALWVIHAQLPDLSGLELYGKLRTLGRQATFILISDGYEAAQELAALAQGNLVYRAKPLDFAQLDRIWAGMVERFTYRKPVVQEALISART